MGWSRFDDGYMDHPKIMDAGPWPELLDRRAIEHCAKYETDGFVSRSGLRRIGRDIPKVSQRVLTLLAVGRWEAHGDGWMVHDFLKFNPSKVAKEADREENRERQRAHREKLRNGVTNEVVTNGRGNRERVVSPKIIERCRRCERLSMDCDCPPLGLVGEQ